MSNNQTNIARAADLRRYLRSRGFAGHVQLEQRPGDGTVFIWIGDDCAPFSPNDIGLLRSVGIQPFPDLACVSPEEWPIVLERIGAPDPAD